MPPILISLSNSQPTILRLNQHNSLPTVRFRWVDHIEDMFSQVVLEDVPINRQEVQQRIPHEQARSLTEQGKVIAPGHLTPGAGLRRVHARRRELLRFLVEGAGEHQDNAEGPPVAVEVVAPLRRAEHGGVGVPDLEFRGYRHVPPVACERLPDEELPVGSLGVEYGAAVPVAEDVPGAGVGDGEGEGGGGHVDGDTLITFRVLEET